LVLRGYREEDRRAVARLAADALDGSVEEWEKYYDPEKNPRLDPEQVYVLEEDVEIRAKAAVLPLEVFVDGKPVPMGGIVAVATHAAYRRRGYAGELMRAALGGIGSGGSISPCYIPSHIPSTAATTGNSPPKR
jgi:predicted acetyltransferase